MASKFAILFLLLLFQTIAFAQENKESRIYIHIPLYFHINQSKIDSAYHTNNIAIRQIDSLICYGHNNNQIDSIQIAAYTSPDGTLIYNAELSVRRAAALKKLLISRHPSFGESRITATARGIDWQTLRKRVESDPGTPHRDRILLILDTDQTEPDKLKQFHEIGDSSAYKYLTFHHFKQLRNAMIRLSYQKPETPPETPPPPPVATSTDTCEASTPLMEPTIGETPCADSYRSPIGLKTNLLSDLATLLNVELEYRIAPHWSIMAEGSFSWWNINHYKYSLHTNYGLAEARYYLGGRSDVSHPSVSHWTQERPKGWFFGIHAGAGRFGITYPSEGYMGDLVVSAGINVGFTHTISRYLSMEYSLGVGYVMSNYKYFLVKNEGQQLLWQHDARYQGILPTRAKVSLVWWIPFKTKKGGTQP